MEQEALIGRTIADKYVIESYIGGGGMGSVYRARQAGLDKIVAIKVLHPEFATEASFVMRFKREAKAASRIDHPNSLRVLDFGQEPDGLLYIVMEYLKGRSLYAILREEAPLEPDRIIALFRQALGALAAAHDLGIVHRDIKPDNIIVLQRTADEGHTGEHVKVCDFGIAKFTENTQVTAAEKLTSEGTIIGTPDYLSPEQARSDAIDARSDLYSMGVILFEAMTGRTPFRADTPLGVVLQHLDAEPPKPSTLAPGVDPRLEAVCLKCLKKNPDERYSGAREMRAALSPESLRPGALAARGQGVAIPREPRVPAALTPPRIQIVTPSGPATPPPVSSTPAPAVPLLLTRKHGSEPMPRPRLAELAGAPEPSSLPGILFAILTIAVTGGVATWLFRGASPPPRAPRAVASAVAPTAQHSAPVVSAPAPAPAPSAPTEQSLNAGLVVPVARAGKGSGKPAGATADASSPVTGSRMVVGLVRSTGNPADVVSALPSAAIADCYREAMKGGAFEGKATLHLEFAAGATRPSFRAEAKVSRLSDCVQQAAHGMVAPWPGDADVELSFLAQ